MADLQCSVYVAPPIPFFSTDASRKEGMWSPISCTLIYSATEAVLVDTPVTAAQTEALISWIETVAPRRKLVYIYVTHGHGDHFFGIPVLLKRFPDAVPVATPGVVAHMAQQLEESVYQSTWEVRLPGQIHQPQVLAKPLPDGRFVLGDRWEFQAIECGQGDTHDSTVLWVPELKLAVCGDVVYGSCHQMLLETNTKAKRAAWIRAIEKVEALRPFYVVPGHKQPDEIDGFWHLAATKRYIEDFEMVLSNSVADLEGAVRDMIALYPDRLNVAALRISCLGAFAAQREERS